MHYILCITPLLLFLVRFRTVDAYFRARCLARRFMKQQVTVAMMRIPTNRAEETPTTSGMSSRSAAGETRRQEAVT